MRRRWLIIPIGILVVLAVFAVARTSGQVRHADGGGPLASKNIPDDWESFYAARVEGITSWTYGVPLCLAQGTTPAVITSVAPAATIGSGFTSLGAKARTFTWTSEVEPMISEDGYPPPKVSPDTLKDPAGFAVTTGCSYAPGQPYTELLVGLGVTPPEDDGGGWHGVLVRYTVGGAEHELAIDNNMIICGRSVADSCQSGPPSPSGS